MSYELTHEQAAAVMRVHELYQHGLLPPASYVTEREWHHYLMALVKMRPATEGDGSTARSRPVSTSLRVIDRNPGHVTASLWVGRTPGARGNAGQIVLRVDEFDELIAQGWVDETTDNTQPQGEPT